MKAGQESGIKELENFVKGIKQDRAAVKAALKFEWSQGQVEGQVNRLKMLKRQMYGGQNSTCCELEYCIGFKD